MFSNRTGPRFRAVVDLIILLSIVSFAKATAAEAQTEDNPKIEILVAKQKVEKGTLFTASLFDSILMVEAEVRLNVLKKEDLGNLRFLFAARTILPNKPLTIDDLSGKPVGPIKFPDEYREVTALVSDDIKDDVADVPLGRFETATVLLHERSTGQDVVLAPVVKILAMAERPDAASKAAGRNSREVTLIAAKADAIAIEQASAKGVIRVCGRCAPAKDAQEEQLRREEKAVHEVVKEMHRRMTMSETDRRKMLEEQGRREEKAQFDDLLSGREEGGNSNATSD